MVGWELTWVVYLGISVLAFAGLELAALKTSGEDATLSATLRKWLGVTPKRWWAMLGASLFAGLLAWLGLHVILGVLP